MTARDTNKTFYRGLSISDQATNNNAYATRFSAASMDERMRIAYLIPEFPAQTHNFFWNERLALQGVGVDTLLISTRRPNKALVSRALRARG